MTFADELQKLEDLRQRGALNDDEFAAAKAAVLAGLANPQAALQAHVADIRRQNELARIDREWEIERERHLITGRYGRRYVPSRTMAILSGVVVATFGGLWTGLASNIGGGIAGGGSLFPLFGLAFILLGLGMSVYLFVMAGRYRSAWNAYQQRRAEALQNRSN